MSALSQEVSALGQTVLVLQGGGALGAYQVGVYQALEEAGIQPDWVVGTSIGAKAFSAVGAEVTVVIDGRGATVKWNGSLSDESAPAIPGSEDSNPGNFRTAV